MTITGLHFGNISNDYYRAAVKIRNVYYRASFEIRNDYYRAAIEMRNDYCRAAVEITAVEIEMTIIGLA